MGSDVNVPEEAVRVLAQSLWWAEHDYGQALGADWVDVGGKVTAWEGAAEDELAEAIEAAEKLTAALDTEADHA